MKNIITVVIGLLAFAGFAVEREYIWPKGKMPDAQNHQFARMTDEEGSQNRITYIEWLDKPESPNGGVIIMISGGAYNNCCDTGLIRDLFPKCFENSGFQLVNFCYRTPRPHGLPIYQTAWEDGQRAVRIVRSEAAKRGFNPERIGVIAMSAGSHLATLLATSSLTPAYEPVDDLDKIPCNINFAIACAPAYGLTTSVVGKPDANAGVGGKIAQEFKFDENTCPMCLLHGGTDPYSPLASTQIYRQLRRIKVPAELHLYSDRAHGGFFGPDNWQESVRGFIRQLNLDRQLGPEFPLLMRFASDQDRDLAKYRKEYLWPEGKMPDKVDDQRVPYIEWHFPREQKTKAIQIIYSGGGYWDSVPLGFEVAPFRRFLNEKGMTVVTMDYRIPNRDRPHKHLRPWQDLQRAIRMVRSQAPALGLDPDRIGIMGSSAGGHLTLMGALSSTKQAYAPIDDLDNIPCNVNWAVGIYPAYSLTDGVDVCNTTGGNDDSAVHVPEFAFDDKCCPMVFIHGDADEWAAMNSVKTWERLREMGIQCDLHTLAKRVHCFHRNASEGTGSYNWMNRIWEFMTHKGFNK